MGIKTELLKALETLDNYCDSINKYPTYSCKGCAFDKARTDMGMTCRVADLLDEKQYMVVLKGE